jgi:hypothetical protein
LIGSFKICSELFRWRGQFSGQRVRRIISREDWIIGTVIGDDLEVERGKAQFPQCHRGRATGIDHDAERIIQYTRKRTVRR